MTGRESDQVQSGPTKTERARGTTPNFRKHITIKLRLRLRLCHQHLNSECTSENTRSPDKPCYYHHHYHYHSDHTRSNHSSTLYNSLTKLRTPTRLQNRSSSVESSAARGGDSEWSCAPPQLGSRAYERVRVGSDYYGVLVARWRQLFVRMWLCEGDQLSVVRMWLCEGNQLLFGCGCARAPAVDVRMWLCDGVSC